MSGRSTAPPPPRRRVSLGLLAGAAASVAAMAVGIAWANSGGTPHRTADRTAARAQASAPTTHSASRTATTHRAAAAHQKPKPKPPTVTGVPAASTTPTPTAQTLEAQGHALLAVGDYAQAIPTLRSAVAAASPSSLTYAYALFDLGRALRLSGHLEDAVKVLYRRLQIPNQSGVVRAELQLALQALGQTTGKHDHGHGRGHGKGDGGAGLATTGD